EIPSVAQVVQNGGPVLFDGPGQGGSHVGGSPAGADDPHQSPPTPVAGHLRRRLGRDLLHLHDRSWSSRGGGASGHGAGIQRPELLGWNVWPPNDVLPVSGARGMGAAAALLAGTRRLP